MNFAPPVSDMLQLANCIRALDRCRRCRQFRPSGNATRHGRRRSRSVLEAPEIRRVGPNWADRDRFVLSNGHGSMLLYSALYLAGYKDVSLDELKNFRQWGSKTAGHPEYGHTEGVELTTGPLGQGLASSVGMAIAERALADQFGKDIVDHRTYVFCGDGCLMEGVGQEAISRRASSPRQADRAL